MADLEKSLKWLIQDPKMSYLRYFGHNTNFSKKWNPSSL